MTTDSDKLFDDFTKAYKKYMAETLLLLKAGTMPAFVPYMDVKLLGVEDQWALAGEYLDTKEGGLLSLVPSNEIGDAQMGYFKRVALATYPTFLDNQKALDTKINQFLNPDNKENDKLMVKLAKLEESDEKGKVEKLLLKPKPLRNEAPEFIPGKYTLEEEEDLPTFGLDEKVDQDILLKDEALMKAIANMQAEMERVQGTGTPLTRQQAKLVQSFNMLQAARPKHIADVLAGRVQRFNNAIMALQGYTGKETRNEYLAYHYAKIISSLAQHNNNIGVLLGRLNIEMEPLVEFEQMRRAFTSINGRMNSMEYRSDHFQKFKRRCVDAGVEVPYPAGEKPYKVKDGVAEVVVLDREKHVYRPHFYKFGHTLLSPFLIGEIFNRQDPHSDPQALAELRANLHYVITHSYFGTNLHGFLERLYAVLVQSFKSARREKENVAKHDDIIQYVFDNPKTYTRYFARMGFKFKPNWAAKLPIDPLLWEDYLRANNQPVYEVNLVAEEGLPFSPYKKFECMTARVTYNREVYALCQHPGVKLLRLRKTFPHLIDYVAKPKGELYELTKPMDTQTALDTDKMRDFEYFNLDGKKTRTIGIPSCAAHLLNSLCAPIIKGAVVDRSYTGLQARLMKTLFPMANFQFGEGKFDLLIKRITGQKPFEFKGDDDWFFRAHFSDNIFMCTRGKDVDEVDPSIVHISAYHPEYPTLSKALQTCLEKGTKFRLGGLRLFLSGDGVKMESGTTARRAQAFCQMFTQYVGYPDHVMNFMKIVAPSLIAGGRLLVGDVALKLDYMISGNPLTFTMNDFASNTILLDVTPSTTMDEVLQHAWDNFGYEFTWERVVILPPMGEPLCPGSQILDLDLLGYAVYHADASGEYLPILQPVRQDRMIISEKRGEKTTREGSYNKFLAAYFLGGWQRPAYSQLIKRLLMKLAPTEGEDEGYDIEESGIEREIREFVTSSGISVASLSENDVHRFFSGSLIFNRLGIGRGFILSVPKIELQLDLYDPTKDHLYEKENWRVAQRLLKTRLELAGLKIPTQALATHKSFQNDILDTADPSWPKIVDLVGAKQKKLSFWQSMAKVVANSHPELTTSYTGREAYAKMIDDKEKEERKILHEKRAAEKKARQELAIAKVITKAKGNVAPSVVVGTGPPAVIVLNRSKVKLYTPVVPSDEKKVREYVRDLFSHLWKTLFSKVEQITDNSKNKTAFGAAVVALYDISLKQSKTYFNMVRDHLFYLPDLSTYTMKELNDVSLDPVNYKVKMTTERLGVVFRQEVISFIVTRGLARVLTDMGAEYSGAVGTVSMMDIKLYLKAAVDASGFAQPSSE